MKFGKVSNPETVDFSLPEDQYFNNKTSDAFKKHVGFPRWSKKDLPGLYPKGIKDELAYYSEQLNAIELNATYYNTFPAEQIAKWRDRTEKGFLFFPKVHQYISHIKRLTDTGDAVEKYADSVAHFEEKLGISFLQMHDNFDPSNIKRLAAFAEKWPKGIRLAIELRHGGWYSDPVINNELLHIFKENGVSTVITDTAGRRDLVHMQLSTNHAFVRFVGCDHPVDFERLNDWSRRLIKWKNSGLESFNLFVHQNQEIEAPQLSKHFIRQINRESDINHPEPHTKESGQTSLF
ncbi:MAG: DUF72 domain-containing protein [Cyclobacteriaceae bacterium]